jgi:hypothetical protein
MNPEERKEFGPVDVKIWKHIALMLGLLAAPKY